MSLLRKTIELTLALVLSSAASHALARTHTDKAAGLSFTDPWKKAQLQSKDELALANANPAASAGGVTYTSGFGPGPVPPFVRVWIKSAEGQLSRAAIKTFAEGDADFIFKMLGIQNFKFDKKTIRGQGNLPVIGGVKTKLLMQLVKNQYSYVGFFYLNDADLKLWSKITGSLKVLPAMKLDVKKLPAGGGGGILQGALIGALIGGIVGGAAAGVWYVMRKKKAGKSSDGGTAPEVSMPPTDLAS